MEAKRARNGWRDEETALLMNAVEDAAGSGRPLREVFSDLGERLGRKPNSIRNYYYARLREMPGGSARKAAFQTFDAQELHRLLREVLIARGSGISVRACVMRMAQGDRRMMLRYQNKYRSVLKNRPEMLERVRQELISEGMPCPAGEGRAYGALRADENESRIAHLYQNALTLSMQTGDRTLETLLEGLNGLLMRACAGGADEEARRENDRLRVKCDLIRLEAEDDITRVRDAVRPLVSSVRELADMDRAEAESRLGDFLSGVSGALERAEKETRAVFMPET